MKTSSAGAAALSVPNGAALSEDGNLAAVVLPSLERRILQVFQVENGLLQTTLNARQSDNNIFHANTDSSRSALGSESLKKVLFCGNNYVAALSSVAVAATFSAEHLHQHSQVLVWDLSRGGVVAHSIGGDEWNSSKRFLDVASHDNHLYFLVAVAENGEGDGESFKLQIHQYDPSSGRLVRKIKCGKASLGGNDGDSEFGLALWGKAAGNKPQFVVRNGNGSHGSEAFRILDVESGSKVGKIRYREGKKQAKKDGTGGSDIHAVNNFVILPRNSAVALYCAKSGQWMKTIPAASTNPTVRVWDAGSEGSVLTLVDDKLYHCTSKDGAVEVSKVTMDRASAIIPRSMKQAVVVMYNPGGTRSTYQVQLLDWSPLSSNIQDIQMIGSIPPKIELYWAADDSEEPTVTTKEVPSNKKRNSESILGPGQAGHEIAAVSERTPKKAKQLDMVLVDTVTSEGSILGTSIADRLKQLVDVDDIIEDDDGGQSSVEKFKTPITRKDFVAKRATTEALAEILSQALRGGDDGLLELALSVRDRNVLRQTMRGLDSYCIDILLAKLTTRLASKPQRAEELAFWLSCVLESGRVQQMGQLQPLKNLLQDRIDAFPHLLRLEGRLSMVNAEKRQGRKKPEVTSLM